MLRNRLIALILPLAFATAACGAPAAPAPGAEVPAAPDAQTRSAAPAGAEAEEGTCPVADPSTNPPTCPEGCIWDGSKCKDQRGVIVDQ